MRSANLLPLTDSGSSGVGLPPWPDDVDLGVREIRTVEFGQPQVAARLSALLATSPPACRRIDPGMHPRPPRTPARPRPGQNRNQQSAGCVRRRGQRNGAVGVVAPGQAALGDQGADAGGGEEGRDAAAAGLQLLGQSALRGELDVSSPARYCRPNSLFSPT